ncbi:CDP-glycerol glycerophosphotransferase family protein [Bacillus sp. V5-8f]|uniref:CDP-glycerol glycerophosphotransferase family protein n=1 Tax=Bacillus sp. V5-8f TaxID=2053044 RepID=UPI000C76DCFF|nr:CDP-glycerol glycerophosphotransferase family protein [Bacillus sp. V5-8f]PLT33372.1 CDP-glycerol--glycerophosphate glycerophosphotransferase [Bacillus sp. V5-8f]
MVRELAIFLFLLVFRLVFFLFNLLPLKDKTTFIVSFGDNSKYVLEEMWRQNIEVEVAVLCKRNRMDLFIDYTHIEVVPFDTLTVFHWLKSIYHLATSRYIMVDNYYGFLAAVHFKKGVECIQLWHASGAWKKFGLEDESIKYRSPKARKRFSRVYSRFHKVVVGSDAMAAVFMKSFSLNAQQILRTGVPRTDFFFNEKLVKKARHTLAVQYPMWKTKKVILYAPTYRDNELEQFTLQLDLQTMAEKLGNDYILLLRLHPAIQNTVIFSKQYSDFVVDVSSIKYEMNELLVAADYLITDYSSIVFEYSLMKKPIIFFIYDLEQYKHSRGVVEEFEHHLPGPIARATNSIIETILSNEFNLHAIHDFSEIWNKYSKGYSSYHLVQYMFPEKVRR